MRRADQTVVDTVALRSSETSRLQRTRRWVGASLRGSRRRSADCQPAALSRPLGVRLGRLCRDRGLERDHTDGPVRTSRAVPREWCEDRACGEGDNDRNHDDRGAARASILYIYRLVPCHISTARRLSTSEAWVTPMYVYGVATEQTATAAAYRDSSRAAECGCVHSVSIPDQNGRSRSSNPADSSVCCRTACPHASHFEGFDRCTSPHDSHFQFGIPGTSRVRGIFVRPDGTRTPGGRMCYPLSLVLSQTCSNGRSTTAGGGNGRVPTAGNTPAGAKSDRPGRAREQIVSSTLVYPSASVASEICGRFHRNLRYLLAEPPLRRVPVSSALGYPTFAERLPPPGTSARTSVNRLRTFVRQYQVRILRASGRLGRSNDGSLRTRPLPKYPLDKSYSTIAIGRARGPPETSPLCLSRHSVLQLSAWFRQYNWRGSGSTMP